MKNAIILCSGGLDSVVTAYYVKNKLNYDNLKFLFFNYDQRTFGWEKKAVEFFCSQLKGEIIEVKLEWLGLISDSLINNSKSVVETTEGLKNTKEESDRYYVPFRNGIFLSQAISLADSLFVRDNEVWDIFVGFKCEGQEPFPDATSEFVKAMNNLMKVGKVKGRIIAPLIEKDKEDIVLLGKELDVDLSKTYSCYIGNLDGQHCGKCLACRLRRAGFKWANVEDDTEYIEREDIR